jgi:hypothetical protein
MAKDKGNPQAVEGYEPPDNSEELEQGFRGLKVDPRDNSEYSLESGPDSPSALEQMADARDAAQADAEASAATGQRKASSGSSSSKGDSK